MVHGKGGHKQFESAHITLVDLFSYHDHNTTLGTKTVNHRVMFLIDNAALVSIINFITSRQ